jgi:ABC-2 type transport system ATP-binding protein
MALRLVSVTQRFGKQLVLDNVSLHVHRGDIYGFIGHNGAGKTTAARIALGLIRPQSGRVVIDGIDAARNPREARARMGGLVEVPGFYGWWSGHWNLFILARLQGLSRADSRREADRLLEELSLADAGAKPVRAYSQGMRQRLGIAQALVGNPPYVILDEPTNGLDPQGIEDVRTLLRRLASERGTTVLLSSHRLREVSDLCTRIGVLRQGKLLVEEQAVRLLGAGPKRYLLVTGSGDAAPRQLAKLGIEFERRGDDEVMLDMADRSPGDVARGLVEAGVELRAFSPHVPTLEEIYFRYARGDAPAPVPAESEAEEHAEHERGTISPVGLPVLKVVRYEAHRWFARLVVPLLLGIPAVLGAFRVVRRHMEARGFAQEVGDGTLFSTTEVTAFEGMALGLQSGLPLAALIIAALASQSIAAELARGTLRNVLLRPVRRAHVAAGKALVLLGCTLATYLLLVVGTWIASAAAFDFTAVVEILPNGQRFTLVAAEELWPELRKALMAPVVPLAAYAGVGFLAGALMRSGAGALGLAFGGVVFLDLVRTVARPMHFEGWLPSAYLPSPLSDTSFLQYYADIATGVSNASFDYGSTAFVVPILWLVVTLLLASLILMRRPVP